MPRSRGEDEFGGRIARKARAPGEDSGTPWREILNGLKAGEVVQIPVADADDLDRKQQQLRKRAERHGFAVEVNSGEGVLRARRSGDIDPGARERDEPGGDRQARREQRRAGRGLEESGGT